LGVPARKMMRSPTLAGLLLLEDPNPAAAGLDLRLFENPGIVALNLDDGGIAQIIHVDGGGRSSTVCSSTRSPSRAPETWLSAARVLPAV
jgi:hypothetical protein